MFELPICSTNESILRRVSQCFSSGQIEWPAICSFADWSDKIIISMTSLSIDRQRSHVEYVQSQELSEDICLSKNIFRYLWIFVDSRPGVDI